MCGHCAGRLTDVAVLNRVGRTGCRFVIAAAHFIDDEIGTEGASPPPRAVTSECQAGVLTQSELVTSLHTSVHVLAPILSACWFACFPFSVPSPTSVLFLFSVAPPPCSFLGTQDGALGTCSNTSASVRAPLHLSPVPSPVTCKTAWGPTAQGCPPRPLVSRSWWLGGLCAPCPLHAPVCSWLPLEPAHVEEEVVDTFSGGELRVSCGRKRGSERIRKLSVPRNLNKAPDGRGVRDHLTGDGPEAPQPPAHSAHQLWSCWESRRPQACICVRISLPAPEMIAQPVGLRADLSREALDGPVAGRMCGWPDSAEPWWPIFPLKSAS